MQAKQGMLRTMEKYLAILPHSWPIRSQRVEDHLIVFFASEKKADLSFIKKGIYVSQMITALMAQKRILRQPSEPSAVRHTSLLIVKDLKKAENTIKYLKRILQKRQKTSKYFLDKNMKRIALIITLSKQNIACYGTTCTGIYIGDK